MGKKCMGTDKPINNSGVFMVKGSVNEKTDIKVAKVSNKKIALNQTSVRVFIRRAKK